MAEQELSVESNKQSTPTVSKRERGFAVSKRSRGRSGCLNCRHRRKKCDEEKPSCAKCTTRGESCEWDTGIIFRLSGIGTYHPSMVQSRNLKAHSDTQFANITFDNSVANSPHAYQAQQLDAMSQHSSSSNEQSLNSLSRENNLVSTNNAVMTGLSSRKHSSSQVVGTSNHVDISEVRQVDSTAISLKRNSNSNSSDCKIHNSPFSSSVSHTSPARSTSKTGEPRSEMGITPGFGSIDSFNSKQNDQIQPAPISSELEALDYLTSQPNNLDFFTSTVQQSGSLLFPRSNSDLIHSPFLCESDLSNSPNLHTNYYSNPSYQDLHTTLYHHIVETARNTALTRQASPDPFAQQTSPIMNDTLQSSPNINEIRTRIQKPNVRLQPLKSVKLTQRRQLELWRNYLDEIAVWLDMFDNDRHFQFKIPLLAKSADHLHYSILALSARQMERKGLVKTYTESLGLYQEAIQLIVKELYTLDTTVIASCVLLCVLEMMSSSPRAWCRHLNGCAMLLEAAGVNGVVGGVRQSLFWCFARMDVWGGFLEDTLTKIPTSRWFLPSGSMIEAVTHFKSGCGSHSYANYAVFLCASVVNVIFNKIGSYVGQVEADSIRKNNYSARWKALFDLLEDWYNNRPEEMLPLMACPSSSDEPREPFSIVLYGSSPAVNGNQLYHAAAILMLQDKPKDIFLSKSPKSILWHARQICGIGVSNSDHGARINSLQPLWIAGKIMSHETEHRAILNLLAQIEKDTGWATAWRTDDLMDYWGDSKCLEMH